MAVPPILCATGLSCITSADCSAGTCNRVGRCVTDTSCDDGPPAGAGETDVDCGGTTCPGCLIGENCSIDDDCQSGRCVGGTCVEVSCASGAQDGDETDTDCGGPICDACADTQGCLVHGDCQSGYCDGDGDLCAAAACSNGVRDGSERGVDCGGGCGVRACECGASCLTVADCSSGNCNSTSALCVP
jgi:hypothetical protein